MTRSRGRGLNPSAPFIRRPVATTLLTLMLSLVGVLGWRQLPVAPLPQIEFPTLQVSAGLPGASPDVVASTLVTPLERYLGQLPGLTEMSSSSSLGGASIILQFGLEQNIDAMVREAQSAMQAARSLLPLGLPMMPIVRKVNPADTPVVILSLASKEWPRTELYRLATQTLQPRLSQISGVGQVMIGGSSLPGIRITLEPGALSAQGVDLDRLKTRLEDETLRLPLGHLDEGRHRLWLVEKEPARDLAFYQNLRIPATNGTGLPLESLARVTEEAEDLRAIGFQGDKPCVILMVNREPGANIIDTAERVKALLPQLQDNLPAGVTLTLTIDRTLTIRASVEEVTRSLLLSIVLVVLVVYGFLGQIRTTLIPVIAIPVSLLGTFGVMALLDYSLNNLTLMALTIATGFVVDDAIVVTENIARHLKMGIPPREAALRGSREIAFTVLSISLSLVAVFVPLLWMDGMLGRLFREFSVTLATAVLISMVISLITTPMLCSRFLEPDEPKTGRPQRLWPAIERVYARSLIVIVERPGLGLILTLGTLVLTLWAYVIIPKGFFPQQDTGRLIGQVIADQSASYQSMVERLKTYIQRLEEDPAIRVVVGFTGGSGPGGGGSAGNTARIFSALKPLEERQLDADGVMARLRSSLRSVPGAQLFLQPPQDLRIGGRMSATQWQYTLTATDPELLQIWAPKVLEAMRQIPLITDLSMDQQLGGLKANVRIDRDQAMRLGVTVRDIDEALYNAFGQRQVATRFSGEEQTHLVLSVPLTSAEQLEALAGVHVKGNSGQMIPLPNLARFEQTPMPLTVNHSGQFPSTTLSFNLLPGQALSDAIPAIRAIDDQIGLPLSVKGQFQGAALAFQSSLTTLPLLLLAALISVYIVLAILYEDLLHPLTILSTIPSAGIGALLGLMALKLELNVIGIIGIILLIGIVKKNAIMMIDFALAQVREEARSPKEAILEAARLRLRPILMTTVAALLGALPLALGRGPGFELRLPLGISLVGGLALSQVVTLYTTPVIYLLVESLRRLPGTLRRTWA